jgi:hypothetical protein
VTTNHIDRREAVRRVSVLLGGAAFVGGSALLEACAGDRAPSSAARGAGQPIGTFTAADQAYLDEIADTILPETEKSPGAKAAATGPFMAVMVTDCYTPDDQQIFRTGMATLDQRCRAAYDTEFVRASPTQRLAIVQGFDQEQYDYMRAKTADQPTHFFRMMKELALLGFFTSEIGCTVAQRYKESPGPYQACVPYVKGETSWAAHA